ncbi:MAG: isoleucine--tRNA ligase [Dehalococcoidales bacterium]|nr:isoleucine--tRNA ligase [Dehalococcoidales bacterium]
MFKPISSKVSFPEMEGRILRFWKENNIFEKSVEARANSPVFTFYEGPPTANGNPGIHHVLARVFKDLVPRYRTMKGYYVPRKGGWDTHGLPVELEIEKLLGIRSKPEIEAYGIADFNQKCRESVFRYVKEWEAMTDRIGFWIDMKDAYVTYENSYVESCWWILKQVWDKGLMYQDYRVSPYCPRCGTTLSSHEVALGYDEARDPSVYVKFEASDPSAIPGHDGSQVPVFFLAWTTTPWTLPGNAALAVNPDAEYVLVETQQDEKVHRLILARALLDQALVTEYTIVGAMPGSALVGLQYKPLYTFVKLEAPAHRVIAGDFVSLEDGTGIVHIAPAFGEIDLEMGRKEGLPVIQTVDLQGNMIAATGPFAGLFVKDADALIIKDLKSRGQMYRAEHIVHTYPFCWRCETPLLYYAKSSWYVRTTALKDQLLAGNDEINWYPEHIKYGRFGDWLRTNVDWAISRERYWGTPLNIWRCKKCGEAACIGSIAELEERSGRKDLHETLDLHRPYVDEITLKCSKCKGEMRRVPDVIDAWFDSGSMPVGQWHFPFENQALFVERFPADFICEAVDQTRGWFYSLHAVATLLFAKPSFKNVICLGHILDAKGEKMSKSRGNVVDPWSVLDKQGADALRWYLYTASPPGNPRRFSAELVSESLRKFLLTLWNTYSFFVTYANIDKFTPQPGEGDDWSRTADLSQLSALDQWILSELHSLVKIVDDELNAYDVTGAARAIEQFVDNLSNWYVRRSRRRFWKSESDVDKQNAYHTLHECLVTVSKLLAPFTPFIADELHQNLVRSADPAAPESVHLASFPTPNLAIIDETLMAHTRLVMKAVSLGRAARAKANIKVRQPLAQGIVKVRNPVEEEALNMLKSQALEELNVKELSVTCDESQLVTYSVKGKLNLLGPKYGKDSSQIVRQLQQLDPSEVARKVRAGEPVQVDGRVLSPDEIEVIGTGREGYALVREGDYLAAVSTQLTPELVEEGLARELVHRIQTLRKTADFRIEEYINTYYDGSPMIDQVMKKFASYIKQETLSKMLVKGAPPAGACEETVDIDGHKAVLAVSRK